MPLKIVCMYVAAAPHLHTYNVLTMCHMCAYVCNCVGIFASKLATIPISTQLLVDVLTMWWPTYIPSK
jgi:hypothetical protein